MADSAPDIAAFLTARWDERQHCEYERAKQEVNLEFGVVVVNWPPEPAEQVIRDRMSAYVLADIAAKRRILAAHRPNPEWDDPHCGLCQWDICCDAPKADYHRGAGEYPCPTVLLLAAPFHDHPDYDAGWSV